METSHVPLWVLKMTETLTVAKEWQSEHTQYLGSLFLGPGPGATCPADTILSQTRSGLLAGVCMHLSTQAQGDSPASLQTSKMFSLQSFRITECDTLLGIQGHP